MQNMQLNYIFVALRSAYGLRIILHGALYWGHLNSGAHYKDVLDRLLEHIGFGLSQTSATYGLLLLPLGWNGQSAAISNC